MSTKNLEKVITKLINDSNKENLNNFKESFRELNSHLINCISHIDENDEPEAHNYTMELLKFSEKINSILNIEMGEHVKKSKLNKIKDFLFNKRTFLNDDNSKFLIINDLNIEDNHSEVILKNNEGEMLRSKFAEKFNNDIAIVSIDDNYYSIYIGGGLFI